VNQALPFLVPRDLPLERRQIRNEITVSNTNAFGLSRRSGGKDDLDGIIAADVFGRSGL
jgi:hypothetical protein